MRLDKFLANNTDYSRSEISKLIRQKRIEVNACSKVKPSLNIDSDQDRITLDQAHIKPVGHVYLMMHKPAGCVCAQQDAEHPTLIDVLYGMSEHEEVPMYTVPKCNGQLQIVGRLDKDTTGLILLTTDGQWNHNISSPKQGCEKTYIATLEHDFDHSTLAQFNDGMRLKGETKTTRPAQIEIISAKQVCITLSEGKYHQVKRMFGATGNHVTALHRERVGHIQLDESLREGQFRPLTAEEILPYLPQRERSKQP